MIAETVNLLNLLFPLDTTFICCLGCFCINLDHINLSLNSYRNVKDIIKQINLILNALYYCGNYKNYDQNRAKTWWKEISNISQCALGLNPIMSSTHEIRYMIQICISTYYQRILIQKLTDVNIPD